jgi:hypothetical protein
VTREWITVRFLFYLLTFGSDLFSARIARLSLVLQEHSEALRGTESGATLDVELISTTMFGGVPKHHRLKDQSRMGMRVDR